MDDARGPLSIQYREHGLVVELVDVITHCVESVSVGFTRWDEPYVRGPGLYFAVVSGHSVDDYADAMGDNRWPVGDCRVVFDDIDAFYQAASDVAVTRDGAVVVSVDGVLLEQMVRLKDLTSDELPEEGGPTEVEYADWMGTRHMSAADTSTRVDVVATVTLSEENGRVTVFRDGTFRSFPQDELGGKWRGQDG